MKIFARIITCLALVVFIWYILADRSTPFTSNARVKAVVTPVVPKVGGTVVDLPVVNARSVEAGDLLAKIDPRPFELSVQQRRAELDTVAQELGVSSKEVEKAQAELTRAQSSLENTRTQTARLLELERKKLIPKAQADDARAALYGAQGKVSVAKAALESARQHLGGEGDENPKMRAALANLAVAELELTFTELRAPSVGGIVNLTIAVGAEAQPGKPLMTFVDGRDIWIEAYMTEKNLVRIKEGDPVSVLLDTHPGRVFEGWVERVVSAAYPDDMWADGLPNPQTSTKWLRDPQRFPVRILLTNHQSANPDDEMKLLLNGQANVIVYTGDNLLMNTLGSIYIRIASWLSYVY